MIIKTEHLMSYLIDCKGYSEADLISMLEDGEDLKSLMSDNDWLEFEEFIK